MLFYWWCNYKSLFLFSMDQIVTGCLSGERIKFKYVKGKRSKKRESRQERRTARQGQTLGGNKKMPVWNVMA